MQCSVIFSNCTVPFIYYNTPKMHPCNSSYFEPSCFSFNSKRNRTLALNMRQKFLFAVLKCFLIIILNLLAGNDFDKDNLNSYLSYKRNQKQLQVNILGDKVQQKQDDSNEWVVALWIT